MKGPDLAEYGDALQQSWLALELKTARNFGAALHRWGPWLGGAFNWLEQRLFARSSPFTLLDKEPDYRQLRMASRCQPIDYPKPDGRLSFDKLSSVYLANTSHDEDQPCHLKLQDETIPVAVNLPTGPNPPSATALPGCSRSWVQRACPACRSTRPTASTARPATSGSEPEHHLDAAARRLWPQLSQYVTGLPMQTCADNKDVQPRT